MNCSPLRFALPLALLLAFAGCVGSGETAVVTGQPTLPPSTEEAPAPDAATTPSAARPALRPDAVNTDTVTARRFDLGKMWTFDRPPADYFEEEYDFRPDPLWFDRARLGALRFADYCSASFVSPRGLIMTNHHCGRESIAAVSRSGEDLLENGFYAAAQEDERAVEDLYVDQLIQIEDVTGRVYAERPGRRPEESRSTDVAAQQRARRVEALQEQLTAEAQQRDSSLQVQVVELYDGGQYSAYTFRRYDDVRLVMAPELALGFFGGAADNFTFPRFTLDVSFFRAYDENGVPLRTQSYFSWNPAGTEAGDPVFVVGNPGSTDRLSTVSELEYARDYELPQRLEVLRRRAAILERYVEAQPDSAEAYDLRNAYFSLENSLKATKGELEGLRDPYLIARRRANQQQLEDSILAVDSLSSRYGSVIADINRLQRSKEVVARQAGAFTAFTSPQVSSRVLTRGLYGYFYGLLQRQQAPQERLKEIREEALKIKDWPVEVEEAFIAARLDELRSTLGASDPTVRGVLRGQTPEQVAARLAQNSALTDSARFANLLSEGYLNSGDVSVPVVESIASLFLQFNEQQQGFAATEEDLNAQLARARFAVSDTTTPPDASFSLRIADGRVKGYAYNGTYTDPYTSFYGLYDHYYAYDQLAGLEAWSLPATWTSPPASFDLSTPLNLVSTNDIAGGNSGSPLLDENLQIVGLIFDSNIEALPNTFLYRDEAARAISVDARGILEALQDIYDADRLVQELTRPATSAR